MHTIMEIEDAIVTTLKASPLAAICKVIDSYHGEIDDLAGEAKQLLIQLPAAFVLYAGSHFNEVANRSFDDEMVFTIAAVAKDLRGRANLRTGIYEILESMKDTLIDNNLGLDIEPLHPISIEATLITRAFSIYSFDIKTSMSLDDL